MEPGLPEEALQTGERKKINGGNNGYGHKNDLLKNEEIHLSLGKLTVRDCYPRDRGVI